MFDYSTFLDFIKGYKQNHLGESAFLDSYCSAVDDYQKAVNPTNEEEKKRVKDLLKTALENAKKCREIKDSFSNWINPEGLIGIIEKKLQKCDQ